MKDCFDCHVTDYVIEILDDIINESKLAKENVFAINKLNRNKLTNEQIRSLTTCPKCGGKLIAQNREKECILCGYTMTYKQIIKIMMGGK